MHGTYKTLQKSGRNNEERGNAMTGLGWALLGLAGLGAGFFARSEYEKKHFVTETFELMSEKLREPERNFVFLSDLHNNQFGEHQEILLQAISRIRPDAVLIGGDMMVCKRGKLDLKPALELVRALAKEYPVFYANGNHEERMKREAETYGDSYQVFCRELEKAGVHYLSDESAEFGEDIRIIGCNMKEAYYLHRFTVPQMEEGELERHVGAGDSSRYQIFLLHSPLFFEECCRWGADLTLCGHFHGGTIRLPFLGGVMTPQFQFFLPWCAGRFDREGKTMIVSRGLGTHSINIRFHNKPQLVHIRLKKKEN